MKRSDIITPLVFAVVCFLAIADPFNRGVVDEEQEWDARSIVIKDCKFFGDSKVVIPTDTGDYVLFHIPPTHKIVGNDTVKINYTPKQYDEARHHYTP